MINAFTARALLRPALATEELRPIGGGTAVASVPRAVLGPGTGLGVSGRLPAGGRRHVAITGEGGHVTLAAADEDEAAVIALPRERFGHAWAERALSGPGLVSVYDAVCRLASRAAQPLDPAHVINRAGAASDAGCQAAVGLFGSLLGGVAGNLALTLGTRGGASVGGGTAPRRLREIEDSCLCERFEAKGRFSDCLAGIPTWVIDASVPPVFLGASRALAAYG